MSAPESFLVLGAGVVGLTSALQLREEYPNANIKIVAKHFAGDQSIEYTSAWAGADWQSFATDNGPLERYDKETFMKWEELYERFPEAGLTKIGQLGYFDDPIEESDVLTPQTGKIWYHDLVGGIRSMEQSELRPGAIAGWETKSTFRINVPLYLQWLVTQNLKAGVEFFRRSYPSINALLSDYPKTTLLIHSTGLGALTLADVKDTNMYPTRGQTVLVAEPETPVKHLYFRSTKAISPFMTYIIPRSHGGGVILGGCMQDGNWDPEPDMEAAKGIMERCCAICPELGKPEDLKVIRHNVGLRPSRKGGPRIEIENWSNDVPVVHNYGHSGYGYQSSWGTAKRAVQLVKEALETRAKL